MKISKVPNEYIEGCLTHSLNIPLENFKDPNYHPCFNTIVSNWSIADHWLVRLLWDSKYKIPGKRLVITALKPRGELLVQAFKLCERCHTWQTQLPNYIPYKHAGDWFGRVKIDFISLEIDTLINPPPTIEESIKKGFLEYERKRLRLMKSGENPFRDTQAKGLELLIDAALALANESDHFRNGYWKPFLTAYSKHIEELTKPIWGMGYTKDGKYFRQGGQGRGGTTKIHYGEVTNFNTFIVDSNY